MSRKVSGEAPSFESNFEYALERLQEKAGELRRFGAAAQAAAVEACVAELQAWSEGWREEELTVAEAAAESGYSPSYLYHALAIEGGALPNAGKPRAPRIRRCDLPRKPGTRGQGLIPLERAAIIADLHRQGG